MLFNSLEYALYLPIAFLLYWFVFNRNLKLQNLYIVVVSFLYTCCETLLCWIWVQ